MESVQNHIGSLNWGYRVALKDKSVEYQVQRRTSLSPAHLPQNAYATFVDAHTLKTVSKRGKETQVTAKHILVATGGSCSSRARLTATTER